jgi:hypothetical protein
MLLIAVNFHDHYVYSMVFIDFVHVDNPNMNFYIALQPA